jgi:peptidoglycan/xylan/chitin deacetylase (PgdA/CDA1 family)
VVCYGFARFPVFWWTGSASANRSKGGSIILLHVMNKSLAESLKAVKDIINTLKMQGYTFKIVSELLQFSH